MSLTILSGSPKSGKTRQAYLLAAKVAETGKVLIFTRDDVTVIKDKALALTKGQKWIDTAATQNIFFCPPHTLDDLLIRINLMTPELIVIDSQLGVVSVEELAGIADHTNTQILLVRNTLAVLDH
jgi:hypothetical protein